MVEAFDINQNKKINIRALRNWSKELSAISNHNFKCSNEECDAELILCSYNECNIPAPYFKTKLSKKHIDKCPSKTLLIDYKYEKGDDKNKRYVGQSAFNRIKSKYTNKEKVVNASIYNITSKNREPLGNNNKNKSYKNIKVGPILYDGTIQIEEKTTYRVSLSDISNLNTKDNYLNLNNFGLKLTEDSKNKIINNINEKTIVFISKYINTKNNWRYSIKPNILIIYKEQIIHEQSYNDFENF